MIPQQHTNLTTDTHNAEKDLNHDVHFISFMRYLSSVFLFRLEAGYCSFFVNGEGVNNHANSVPRWQTPSSHTPACSPGTAELPGCWLGCSDSAHPVKTVLKLGSKKHRMSDSSGFEECPSIYYHLHRRLDETFWRQNALLEAC